MASQKEDDERHQTLKTPDTAPQHQSSKPIPFTTLPPELILSIGDWLTNWNDYRAFRHSHRRAFYSLSRNHTRQVFWSMFDKKIAAKMDGFLRFCVSRLRNGTDSDCSEYLRRLLDVAEIHLIRPADSTSVVALDPDEQDWYIFCWQQNLLHGALSTLMDRTRVFKINVKDRDGSVLKCAELLDSILLARMDEDWLDQVQSFCERAENEETFVNQCRALSDLIITVCCAPYNHSISRIATDKIRSLHEMVLERYCAELVNGLLIMRKEKDSQASGWYESCIRAIVSEESDTEGVGEDLVAEVKRMMKILREIKLLVNSGLGDLVYGWMYGMWEDIFSRLESVEF
ncbi:hypothetical protein BJ508DRAFT_374786 [Ascobolus immersus RN42]|uniref:F-box domain-containing protein n=1 Tax=Ascobolus immersus RN42 TaxID=1160509 RepID=A0A3N4ICN0_ASCIM|nr:hypothetical protein BJ508DRAFT_374786 [Ascobolus immersus RN42]